MWHNVSPISLMSTFSPAPAVAGWLQGLVVGERGVSPPASCAPLVTGAAPLLPALWSINPVPIIVQIQCPDQCPDQCMSPLTGACLFARGGGRIPRPRLELLWDSHFYQTRLLKTLVSLSISVSSQNPWFSILYFKLWALFEHHIANIRAAVECRGWVTPVWPTAHLAAWLPASSRWVEAVNHPSIMVTGQCWAALWSLWGQSPQMLLNLS